MTLSKIKDIYNASNTQFILFNQESKVTDSDNILFKVKKGSLISEIHPFFEGIIDVLSPSGLDFSCVHFETKEKKLICDININQLENNLYVVIIVDFSKHYESFQSLAQSRNETAIKSEILAINNQVLKEKEAFKNKFIANFSHEIKSPITSILAFADLINKTKLKDEQQEYLDVIKSSGMHLKSIINDILDISKIETGKLEIVNKQFDFIKLITDLEAEYSMKCENKNLTFDLNLDSNVPQFIESDKTRIRQIIKNLLDNAIKFTDKGRISLSIKTIFKRAQNVTLSIKIKDTGIGIPLDQHNHIFERFNRLGQTENVDGVGLGLTIVKEIIELLNSEISFESQPNTGTTFTITLKAKQTLIAEKKHTPKTKSTILKKNKRKYSILLVEDNDLHQLSIFKILAQTNNFYLDIVNNGLEAVETIKKNFYDLVLMDYQMPFLDGIETAKAIKNLSDKKKNSVPIIMVTGKLLKTDFLKDNKDVIDDIIEKPFDEETLINTIQNSLK